jgi:hypothetical protein
MGRVMLFGSWFTARKARIIEIIARAGKDGIDSEMLRERLGMGRDNLKSHIWQINEKLTELDMLIVGDRGRGGNYRLVKETKKGWRHVARCTTALPHRG